MSSNQKKQKKGSVEYLMKITRTPDEQKELLNQAINFRDFEIKLSWERTKYFSAIVVAIFVAYYSSRSNPLLRMIFPSLGYVSTFIWLCLNRGSKFWQENWEKHIEILSIKLDRPIMGIVMVPYNPPCKLTSSYHYSVSRCNMTLSIMFLLFWAFLIVYNTYYSNNSNNVCSKIFFCFIAIVGILIVSIILHHVLLNFAKEKYKKGANSFFYKYEE